MKLQKSIRIIQAGMVWVNFNSRTKASNANLPWMPQMKVSAVKTDITVHHKKAGAVPALYLPGAYCLLLIKITRCWPGYFYFTYRYQIYVPQYIYEV